MVLGHDGGWRRSIVNHLALPFLFSPAHCEAWLKHNVEEVGCFENFLPALYGQ